MLVPNPRRGGSRLPRTECSDIWLAVAHLMPFGEQLVNDNDIGVDSDLNVFPYRASDARLGWARSSSSTN